MTHGYEMYYVKNVVSNYVISSYDEVETRLIVIILRWIEISKHCFVQQKLTCIIVLLYFKNKQKKRSDLWLPEAGCGGWWN